MRLSDYAGDQVSSQPPVDVEMLDSIISKLHLGKASGIDKLSAEHLRYSHPIVTSILVKLFNLMINCGYVPSGFEKGLTIPIPKCESSKTTDRVDNYRV